MKNNKEIRSLRRPFVKELFRKNKLNLMLTVMAAMIGAAGNLVISWLIKEIVDLISGISKYSISTLLLVTAGGVALLLLAGAIDYLFLPRFRVKAMQQYRAYTFNQLLKKGIQAFSGENMSLYISALSNDVNTIEGSFIAPLQSTIQTGITFVAALALMLWYSPPLTLVAIGFSLLPIIISIVLGNRAADAEKAVSNKKEIYDVLRFNWPAAKKIQDASELSTVLMPTSLLFKQDGTTLLLFECAWEIQMLAFPFKYIQIGKWEGKICSSKVGCRWLWI